MELGLRNAFETGFDNRAIEKVQQSQKALLSKKDEAKLKKACADFESVFINLMLKEMRRTVSEGEFLSSSREEKLWREMQDEKLSEEMAKSNPLGIAKMLYNQLKSKSR